MVQNNQINRTEQKFRRVYKCRKDDEHFKFENRVSSLHTHDFDPSFPHFKIDTIDTSAFITTLGVWATYCRIAGSKTLKITPISFDKELVK